MAKSVTARCPLILRCLRLIDAFAKSDDEKDFYLDKQEGFLFFANLDRSEEELTALEKEIKTHSERDLPIPKLTFFEIKKIMESFSNEKIYDIDTKEKLLNIISSKAPRDHFLEFLHDNLNELEKWQAYYLERSRIQVIAWLRSQELHFVFEEDIDLPPPLVIKLKQTLFQTKVPKEVSDARKVMEQKAKTYYSSEVLHPRPKRGRPPKHVVKVEIEPQFTKDFYQTIPDAIDPFLFAPNIRTLSSVTFSGRFVTEDDFIKSLRPTKEVKNRELEELSRKLASLQSLSTQYKGPIAAMAPTPPKRVPSKRRASARNIRAAAAPKKSPTKKTK